MMEFLVRDLLNLISNILRVLLAKNYKYNQNYGKLKQKEFIHRCISKILFIDPYRKVFQDPNFFAGLFPSIHPSIHYIHLRLRL